MPPTERTGRMQVTGLTPDDEQLIKVVIACVGETLREWVLRHAREDAALLGVTVTDGRIRVSGETP